MSCDKNDKTGGTETFMVVKLRLVFLRVDTSGALIDGHQALEENTASEFPENGRGSVLQSTLVHLDR
jgi:hypothetical protein